MRNFSTRSSHRWYFRKFMETGIVYSRALIPREELIPPEELKIFYFELEDKYLVGEG